jgi:NADPH-dependent 2,4-dienoyl-CoA reductase/sulfur reductase-like enzyme
LRFARAVIDEVRGRVGADFAVGVRISLSDFIPGALDIEDARRVAQALEADGKIDYVNVTAAGYHNIFMAIQPSDTPDGYLVELTAQVKAAVGLPVFTVGGIKDPELAEEILAAGKADMIAMTRAQIADPEFANKVRDGREDELVHCIRGNQGCIGRVFKGLAISCTVNPAAGREARFGNGTLQPADAAARWLVVGGGPAGMRAAATLARRGHEVTLLEQENRLGGQVNLIVKTPGRGEFGWVTKDLERLVRKLGVEVRLSTQGTPELVEQLRPDGVVVATGAVPSRTGFSTMNPLVDRLPGVDAGNVVHAWDVIEGTAQTGERVVVLDGDGGRYAAGTCEVLLDQGRRVEVVTPLNALFPQTLATLDIAILYNRLMSKGLVDRLNCWAKAIEGDRVTVFNLYTGAETVLEGIDTVVLATGPSADDALYFALKGEIENLHRIGDCLAPRKLDHAIYEGELAGRELWDPEERYIYEGELERGEVAEVIA